jgi:hypothetical protein
MTAEGKEHIEIRWDFEHVSRRRLRANELLLCAAGKGTETRYRIRPRVEPETVNCIFNIVIPMVWTHRTQSMEMISIVTRGIVHKLDSDDRRSWIELLQEMIPVLEDWRKRSWKTIVTIQRSFSDVNTL